MYEFQGKKFEPIQHNKLSPSEMDEVERLCGGMTYARIKRQLQTCLCDHQLGAHLRFTSDGKRSDDVSCGAEDCSCSAFEADIPSRVNFALLFMAYRRVEPEARFEDVAQVAQEEWVYTPEPENPTPPPPPAEG